jgi:hypothetical protein
LARKLLKSSGAIKAIVVQLPILLQAKLMTIEWILLGKIDWLAVPAVPIILFKVATPFESKTDLDSLYRPVSSEG